METKDQAMTQNTIKEGYNLYAADDAKGRDWFHRQWAVWPERADPNKTTNISLLYGGVLAYRAEHGSEPELSEDFASHVRWLDRNSEAKP